MADVADEAGLAKGTVYLYFPSKEELLLAVHERNIDGFFRALIARLASDAAGRDHATCSRSPTSTWSSRRCSSRSRRAASASWGRASRAEAALAFKQRMADRLHARRRRPRAALSASFKPGGGARAPAPQLRADHRPLADVGGSRRDRARDARWLGPGDAPPAFTLRLSPTSSTARCSRCGTGRSPARGERTKVVDESRSLADRSRSSRAGRVRREGRAAGSRAAGAAHAGRDRQHRRAPRCSRAR